MKSRYLPIAYCIFTLMSTVAWAADSAQETEVTVYYGFLKWKNLKSQKITFPDKEVSTKKFIDMSLDTYFKEINKSLETRDIMEDFGWSDDIDEAKSILNESASNLIVIGDRYEDDKGYVEILNYEDNILLSQDAMIGIQIEPKDKLQNGLNTALPQEYSLSNVIAAQKKKVKSAAQKSEEDLNLKGGSKDEQNKELKEENKRESAAQKPEEDLNPKGGAKDEQNKELKEENERESTAQKPEEDLNPKGGAKDEQKQELKEEQKTEQENESNNGITTPLIIVGFILVVTAVAAFYKISNPNKRNSKKKTEK